MPTPAPTLAPTPAPNTCCVDDQASECVRYGLHLHTIKRATEQLREPPTPRAARMATRAHCRRPATSTAPANVASPGWRGSAAPSAPRRAPNSAATAGRAALRRRPHPCPRRPLRQRPCLRPHRRPFPRLRRPRVSPSGSSATMAAATRAAMTATTSSVASSATRTTRSAAELVGLIHSTRARSARRQTHQPLHLYPHRQPRPRPCRPLRQRPCLHPHRQPFPRLRRRLRRRPRQRPHRRPCPRRRRPRASPSGSSAVTASATHAVTMAMMSLVATSATQTIRSAVERAGQCRQMPTRSVRQTRRLSHLCPRRAPRPCPHRRCRMRQSRRTARASC